MTRDTPIAFVTSSSVRTDVLLCIAEVQSPTDSLLDRVDASESAVYNALTALERRSLVVDGDDGWRANGKGRLVAEMLSTQRSLNSVLGSAYWETHDTSPIPPSLAVRMGELSDCEVIRADDADPYEVVREVTTRLGGSDDVDIVSPIYQPDYVEMMPDSGSARLVLHPSVLETALESSEDTVVREFEATPVRVHEVPFSLGVTESCLVLSLPTLDGAYDPQSSVVDESTSGIEWGRDLFEHFWTEARPVEEVLHRFDI
jgi:predicted transcriptional regulator